MATGYILIWYTFDPTTDRCLMSFMMEPPKFFDMGVKVKNQISSNHMISPYKLYLYSEFDFPARQNDRFDIRDSFPVLFVPGNSGSYQQVRSLASTCIRRQIQSLDAYKFIFYTIDFGGQLSGLNGKLVEDQTEYVNLCLQKIKEMFSDKFNGVILVGHSVGGFISKSLFTIPQFDPKSVPLIISLSSPLVKPYLTFDYRMRELYNVTNEYWQRYSPDRSRTTTAISISGGKSDRLVPTQLTLDPHFDISLTTASAKDVWFSADHNGITWCREFMYKLSHMLSAVMDKQSNRLYPKPKLIQFLVSQLLNDPKSSNYLPQIISRESKIFKSVNIEKFNGFHQIHRSQFSGMVHLLDISKIQNSGLMIVVDHNNVMKQNGIYGCQGIDQTETGQTTCLVKTNLLDYATPIPSSIYEPQRTIIKLTGNNSLRQLNYIALDFSSSDKMLPESVILLAVNLEATEAIQLPSLSEYLIRTIFRYSNIMTNVKYPFNSILIYRRFVIKNQKFKNQYYTMKFEAHSCQRESRATSGIVTMFRKGYLVAGFTSDAKNHDKMSLSVELKPEIDMIINNANQSSDEINDETILDTYLDGNCQHKITLEFNLLRMIVNLIRTQLELILTCATYIACVKILASHFEIINKTNQPIFMALSGFVVIYHSLPNEDRMNSTKLDIVIESILQFGFAYGLTILLGFILDRLIDVAIILNRMQSYWIRKPNQNDEEIAGDGLQRISQSKNLDVSIFVLVTAMSLVLSAASSSILGLLLLIKLGLSIESQRMKHRFSPRDMQKIEDVHNLLINLGSLSVLSFIANIPAALIKIKTGRAILMNFDLSYENSINLLSCLMCFVLIRITCLRLETFLTKQQITQSQRPSSNIAINRLNSMLKNHVPSSSFHLILLLVTLTVHVNLCHINHALLATLIIINLAC